MLHEVKKQKKRTNKLYHFSILLCVSCSYPYLVVLHDFPGNKKLIPLANSKTSKFLE